MEICIGGIILLAFCFVGPILLIIAIGTLVQMAS